MTAKTRIERLTQIVENTLADTAFEVVDLTYGKSGGNWTMCIFIDHPDGVSFEHCSEVTRLVSDEMDREDPIPNAYSIEVSSPGVDRPLRKLSDFERFQGQRVYIKCHAPVEGNKKFTGTLSAVDAAHIDVDNEHDGKTYRIPMTGIAKATLKPILEF